MFAVGIPSYTWSCQQSYVLFRSQQAGYRLSQENYRSCLVLYESEKEGVLRSAAPLQVPRHAPFAAIPRRPEHP